ncbi:AN1-type zinc finger protein 2A-like [Lineus longissimus]|uniref:AN1-type zinc finger protein 2A-like n=1 Tax=Lineus longissimus TaxID=88925 RepID=UPI00315C5DE5
MELPSLGENCSENSCKQLDFLPMKCDACFKIFCKDHIHYELHRCTESYKKDNQVPVCPLCNKPIPVKPNQLPDIAVNEHIDSDCQSDPAKERRGKVYSNRCSSKGCKQRELIPVSCDKCHKNFCLRHRHESDHDCKGFEDSGRGVSKAAAAAASRQQNATSKKPQAGGSKPVHSNNPKQTVLTGIGRELDSARRGRSNNSTASSPAAVQGGMSEDEALARAIQLSMAEGNQAPAPPKNKPTSQQEEDDLALARAIAASEQEERRQRQRRQQPPRPQSQDSSKEKSSCEVS